MVCRNYCPNDTISFTSESPHHPLCQMGARGDLKTEWDINFGTCNKSERLQNYRERGLTHEA